MTKPQWLLVAFIGVIAVIAYVRSDQIARRIGFTSYLTRKPASAIL